MAIRAVIFDMDGVLLDSEAAWDAAREAYTLESGGTCCAAQRDMMGMSSTEWSRYMHDVLGVPAEPGQISADVVERMIESYRERLPLIDGAVEAVERTAERYDSLARHVGEPPADRPGAARVGLDRLLQATVSSEEVERGKPAPDVYLEAARRLGVDPAETMAVEDSSQRDPERPPRRHVRGRDPEQGVPARRRGACGRGPRARLDRGAVIAEALAALAFGGGPAGRRSSSTPATTCGPTCNRADRSRIEAAQDQRRRRYPRSRHGQCPSTASICRSRCSCATSWSTAATAS